jgi:hypothetical protein
MRKLLRFSALITAIFLSSDAYCQNIYVSFKSDSTATRRKCEVYFSHLKNGVISYDVYVPTNGFLSFRCPLDTSFEIVLDCWKTRIVLDKIFPKCGDSIIVNLDSRTFSFLNKKQDKRMQE